MSDAFKEFYDGGKMPAAAVRLAIEDHRNHNRNTKTGMPGGVSEFIGALQTAADQCEQHHALKLALSNARVMLKRVLDECQPPALEAERATRPLKLKTADDMRGLLAIIGELP